MKEFRPGYLSVLRFYIKLKYSFLFISLILFNTSYSQVKSETLDISRLPQGFSAVHGAENDFILIYPKGEREWVVEKKTTANEQSWEKEIILSAGEYVVHSEVIDGKLGVFINAVNMQSRSSELFLQNIDLKSGLSVERQSLWKMQVGDTKRNAQKARFIASPELELASVRNSGVEVPLLYRYYISTSENKEYFLISFLDYSSDKLVYSYKTLAKDFSEMKNEDLAIDDGIYLYDFGIDEDGDLFHANLTMEGDIQVIRFPLSGSDFSLMKITSGNSIRDDLKLSFLGDERVLIAAKAEADNSFYGALYGIMNFSTNDLEMVHFEPLAYEFEEAADSLMRIGELMVKDWTNYNLSSVSSFNDEEVLLVFESMDFRRSGYVFQDIQFATDLDWRSHKTRISVGPALVYSVDKLNQLRWAKFINKEQVFDSDFLRSSAILNTIPQNEEITFVFNNSDMSFKHRMDYIYNSWSRTSEIGNAYVLDILMHNKKEYCVFLDIATKKLIIKEL